MKDRSRDYLGALSVIAMIVVLAIARGLDALIAYFGRPSAPTFNPWASLYSQALGSVLLAALLLLLFWFVLVRAPRSAWVAAVYLFVGLFLAFSTVLYYVPAIGSLWPVFFTTILSATSHIIVAGGFIAVMGVFMLILPRS